MNIIESILIIEHQWTSTHLHKPKVTWLPPWKSSPAKTHLFYWRVYEQHVDWLTLQEWTYSTHLHEWDSFIYLFSTKLLLGNFWHSTRVNKYSTVIIVYVEKESYFCPDTLVEQTYLTVCLYSKFEIHWFLWSCAFMSLSK